MPRFPVGFLSSGPRDRTRMSGAAVGYGSIADEGVTSDVGSDTESARQDLAMWTRGGRIQRLRDFVRIEPNYFERHPTVKKAAIGAGTGLAVSGVLTIAGLASVIDQNALGGLIQQLGGALAEQVGYNGAIAITATVASAGMAGLGALMGAATDLARFCYDTCREKIRLRRDARKLDASLDATAPAGDFSPNANRVLRGAAAAGSGNVASPLLGAPAPLSPPMAVNGSGVGYGAAAYAASSSSSSPSAAADRDAWSSARPATRPPAPPVPTREPPADDESRRSTLTR